jgi:acetyl-CoA carboxylase biotin carboxyl carrier protein
MAKKKSPPTPKTAPAKPPAKDRDGDHGFVRDLALILRETELTEIEVERNGLRVRVARQMTGAYAPPAPALVHHHATPPAPATSQAPAQAPHTTPQERAQHPGAVKSPMVGTAYRAPSPGAAPFVNAGDTVKEGQTLLIIEAMKTMNQIAAPRSGKIVEILVRDSQPVEYGEVLMIVE